MRKPKVYLHIGMNKTGSTSIQRSFQGYDDGRTRYAMFDTNNSSKVIGTIFLSAPETYSHHARRSVSKEAVLDMRTRWLAQLEEQVALTNETLIVSAEKMSSLSRSEVATLADYFEQRFDQIEILAYVRDPVSFASSAFQQRVKNGGWSQTVSLPNFHKRFENYLERFGADRVQFGMFPPRNHPSGDVVQDYCDRLGCDASRLSIVRTNDSLPEEAVVLLFHWNRDGVLNVGSPETMKARKLFVNRLREVFDGKFILNPDRIRDQIDWDDIGWMENVSGLDLRSEIMRNLDRAAAPDFFEGIPQELDSRIAAGLNVMCDGYGLTPAGGNIATANLIFSHLLKNPRG